MYQKSNYYYLDSEARLLCKSGYANHDGVCSDGTSSSTNKGQGCLDSTLCPGSGGDRATCCCGWNSNGEKICDILAGDEQWKAERETFKDYFEKTKDKCNVAARWEDCGGESLAYHTWKCAYYNATLYTALEGHDKLDCMGKIIGDLPEF
jgi:hypothetical protein